MNTCGGGGLQPKILVETNPIRMVRTEAGKALRKQYESGEIHHGFNEHRKAEIKEDGICNTISTVEKDTLVCEKTIVENLPCTFSKSADGEFTSTENASLKDVDKENANCITGRYYKGIESDNANAVIVAMRGRNPDNPSDRTAGSPTEQRLEPNTQGTSNCLTSVQKDNMVLESVVTTRGNDVSGTIRSTIYKNGTRNIEKNCADGGGYEGIVETRQLGYIEHGTGKHQSNTVYDEKGLSPSITTINGGGTQQIKICEETVQYRIRKLTPKETWRLMDFSDEYFHKAEKVNSNTQLYKQAGNSIVCAVLCAIFSQLGIEGVTKWNDRNEEERRELYGR